MKRVLSLLMVGILLSTFAVAAPVGADEGTLFEAQLVDAPIPGIVGNGKVEIGSDLVAEIKIETSLPNQTLVARMECGPILSRQNFRLGTIETDDQGTGIASFDLNSYPDLTGPALVSPSFGVSFPGGPVCATNYALIGYPYLPPGEVIEMGRIFLVCHVDDGEGNPVEDVGFGYTMSYGGTMGLARGVTLYEDEEIASGMLPPGIYTITQQTPPSNISIMADVDNPPPPAVWAEGSFWNYGTAVVDLQPGQIVRVRFFNHVTEEE